MFNDDKHTFKHAESTNEDYGIHLLTPRKGPRQRSDSMSLLCDAEVYKSFQDAPSVPAHAWISHPITMERARHE